MNEVVIRQIRPEDNQAIAAIIRRSLEEFNANKPGTVYFDDSTDHLFELFESTPGSKYLIAAIDNVIVGGAGIFPTENLPAGVCELVKMYLRSDVRGVGLGRKMIAQCMQHAKEMGYTKIYLETMPELKKAVTVYEKFGFKYLAGPMGNSGHNGCDIWMIRDL
jgi:putative acetyltransferase